MVPTAFGFEPTFAAKSPYVPFQSLSRISEACSYSERFARLAFAAAASTAFDGLAKKAAGPRPT
jgi:hypothetical protein